jgi:hypothetical protein
LSRTILYYDIFVTRNGVKTTVPLNSLIDEIVVLEDDEKFWNRKKLSLLYLKPIELQNPLTIQNRSIAIAKYRESYKPYTGRIGTNIANPIEEDVIEFTNCFFIGRSKQIAIEYNHFGSRHHEIASYISSFLPKDPQNYWNVELEPIETNVGLNDILHSEKIYSIEFTVDCTRDIPATLDTRSFFGGFVEKTVTSHNEFGANVAYIKFGNGRKRIDVIVAEQLVRLLHHLNFEDDLFAAVKVDYHSPNTGRRETIDLKNHNILKSIIMEGDTATGYEYILDQIEVKYNVENRPGSNAYLNYEGELVFSELPPITPHTLPAAAAEAGA